MAWSFLDRMYLKIFIVYLWQVIINERIAQKDGRPSVYVRNWVNASLRTRISNLFVKFGAGRMLTTDNNRRKNVQTCMFRAIQNLTLMTNICTLDDFRNCLRIVENVLIKEWNMDTLWYWMGMVDFFLNIWFRTLCSKQKANNFGTIG